MSKKDQKAGGGKQEKKGSKKKAQHAWVATGLAPGGKHAAVQSAVSTLFT